MILPQSHLSLFLPPLPPLPLSISFSLPSFPLSISLPLYPSFSLSLSLSGAIQGLRNAIFFANWTPTHPPPRNANNIEHYTLVTLFSGKSDTPHPHLRYVTLEWPLSPSISLS